MGILDRFRKKRGARIFNKNGVKGASIINDFEQTATEDFFSDREDNLLSKYDEDGNKIGNIKRFSDNIKLFRKIVKNVPKVGAMIDTQAEFAIQSGYEIIGDKEETEELEAKLVDYGYELEAISRIKGRLVDGNVFYVNKGSPPFKRLPTETIRVRRNKKGNIEGYVQIKGSKVVGTWKPDEIIHLKWNVFGTEPYGTSEIKRLTGIINKKLNMEEAEAAIYENYASPIIMLQIGTEETPASEDEIDNIIADWEDRKVGGDIFAPGDWSAEVLAPAQGIENAVDIKKDIEEQLEAGLRMPKGDSDQGIEYRYNAFDRRIRTLQDMEALYVENYVFPKILGREDNIPKMKFKPLDIEKLLRTSRLIRQLVGNGTSPAVISRDEARDMLGMNPEGKPFMMMGNDGDDEDEEDEETS